MKKIENYGVLELNSEEIKNIEGGIMIGVAICLFAIGVSIGAALRTAN